MESLRENKALLYSLCSTAGFVALLATGTVPELCEQFGIVEFEDEVRNQKNPFRMSCSKVFFSVPIPACEGSGRGLRVLVHRR